MAISDTHTRTIPVPRVVCFALLSGLIVGCGDGADDSVTGGPSQEPAQPAPTATATATATDFVVPPPPPPPAPPAATDAGPPGEQESNVCGPCISDGHLRCSGIKSACVDCLGEIDCLGTQTCIDNVCVYTDNRAVACSETRPTPGASCGFPDSTCSYGTYGTYRCRCGRGAVIGQGNLEPAVWFCETI